MVRESPGVRSQSQSARSRPARPHLSTRNARPRASASESFREKVLKVPDGNWIAKTTSSSAASKREAATLYREIEGLHVAIDFNRVGGHVVGASRYMRDESKAVPSFCVDHSTHPGVAFGRALLAAESGGSPACDPCWRFRSPCIGRRNARGKWPEQLSAPRPPPRQVFVGRISSTPPAHGRAGTLGNVYYPVLNSGGDHGGHLS